MAKPNMLDAIIASQKEKDPGSQVTAKGLEDALAGHDTLSAADLKKLLAGGSIDSPAAPASNVIDIAQDIRTLAENSEVERDNSETVAELAVKDTENLDKIAANNEKIQVIQQDNDLSYEEKAEQIELVREEIEVLHQIEANTRQREQGKSTIFRPDQKDNGSGMLSGIMGFLGGGLTGLLGGLFTGAAGNAATSAIGGTLIKGITGFIGNIFKSLLKGAIITTLVAGLASGLVEGIKEYKESGDLNKAIWEGFKEFVDFISFGLIDKEDMDKLAEYVTAQWKIFEQEVKDFIDFITPDFMKDKKTEGGTEIGLVGRFAATQGETVSTLNFEDGDRKITGEEIVDNKGDNFYKVSVDGKEYRVSKETYFSAKGFADAGNKNLAANILEGRGKIESETLKGNAPEKIKGVVGDFAINESTQMNIDAWGNEIVAPEKSTADNVAKQSENNAAAKQEAAAGGSAPIIVNAPTTNTSSSHTTALPQVKSRNDEYSQRRFFSNREVQSSY